MHRQFQRSTENLIGALHASSRGAAQQLDELQLRAKEQAHAADRLLSGQQAAAEAAEQQREKLKTASEQLTVLQSSQEASFTRAQGAIDGLSAQSRAALGALTEATEELGSKQRHLLGGVDRLLGERDAHRVHETEAARSKLCRLGVYCLAWSTFSA